MYVFCDLNLLHRTVNEFFCFLSIIDSMAPPPSDDWIADQCMAFLPQDAVLSLGVQHLGIIGMRDCNILGFAAPIGRRYASGRLLPQAPWQVFVPLAASWPRTLAGVAPDCRYGQRHCFEDFGHIGSEQHEMIVWQLQTLEPALLRGLIPSDIVHTFAYELFWELADDSMGPVELGPFSDPIDL